MPRVGPSNCCVMILIPSFSKLYGRKRDRQISVEQLLTSCNLNRLCKWMDRVLFNGEGQIVHWKKAGFLLDKAIFDTRNDC